MLIQLNILPLYSAGDEFGNPIPKESGSAEVVEADVEVLQNDDTYESDYHYDEVDYIESEAESSSSESDVIPPKTQKKNIMKRKAETTAKMQEKRKAEPEMEFLEKDRETLRNMQRKIAAALKAKPSAKPKK